MNTACITRTAPAVQHQYSSGSGVNLICADRVTDDHQ